MEGASFHSDDEIANTQEKDGAYVDSYNRILSHQVVVRECEGDTTEKQLPTLRNPVSQKYAWFISGKKNRSDRSSVLHRALNSSYHEKLLEKEPRNEAAKNVDRIDSDEFSGGKLFSAIKIGRGSGEISRTCAHNSS